MPYGISNTELKSKTVKIQDKNTILIYVHHLQ